MGRLDCFLDHALRRGQGLDASNGNGEVEVSLAMPRTRHSLTIPVTTRLCSYGAEFELSVLAGVNKVAGVLHGGGQV